MLALIIKMILMLSVFSMKIKTLQLPFGKIYPKFICQFFFIWANWTMRNSRTDLYSRLNLTVFPSTESQSQSQSHGHFTLSYDGIKWHPLGWAVQSVWYDELESVSWAWIDMNWWCACVPCMMLVWWERKDVGERKLDINIKWCMMLWALLGEWILDEFHFAEFKIDSKVINFMVSFSKIIINK